MKRAIFIDLHGVLLDFVTAAFLRYGKPVRHGPYEQPAKFGCPDCVDIWCDLNEPTFWATLPILAPGCRMLAKVRDFAKRYRIPIYLLTRPLEECPNAIPGTIMAALALGFRFEQIILATDKAAVAPGFLIDDEPDTVYSWLDQEQSGGYIWPALNNAFAGYHIPESDGSLVWSQAERDLMSHLALYFDHL